MLKNKMLFYVSCSVLVMLAFCTNMFAATNQELMHDRLAHAYLAITNAQEKVAIKNFKEAASFASKVKNWAALIDVGNAFMVLGQRGIALKYYVTAEKISGNLEDWRGMAACAYAYISLPNEMKPMDKILSCLLRAQTFATKSNDARGLSEIARLLIEIKEYPVALSSLNQAHVIAKNTCDIGALKKIAGIYEYLNKQKSKEILIEADTLNEKINAKEFEIPAGWSPYIETVAAPQKLSDSTQAANRQSADKDIELKDKWLLEQKRLAQEKENYYKSYTAYYNYPYYYRTYGMTNYYSPSIVSGWASYYLSQYHLVNGTYVYFGYDD